MNEFVFGLILGAGGLALAQWVALWWVGRPPRIRLFSAYRKICGNDCTVTGENRMVR